MKNLKLLFLLLLGVGLTFASCKKDEEEEGGENPPVSKTCYLTKETLDDGSYHEVIYNSDNYVTEYNGYNTSGDLGESNKITYDNNKVSLINVYQGTTLKSKLKFVYSDKLDSVIMYVDTLGVMKKVGYYLYSYNGDNISRMSMYFKLFGQELEVGKNTYAYSGDNPSTVMQYELGATMTLELKSIHNYEYDDKLNPYRNIGVNDLLGDVIFMAKNNITKVTVTDNNGDVLNDKSFNNAYEYNSDNYYTKFVQTYFDNSKVETYTIDYRCE